MGCFTTCTASRARARRAATQGAGSRSLVARQCSLSDEPPAPSGAWLLWLHPLVTAHLHLVGSAPPLPPSRTAGARRARLEDTVQETASICACRTRARRVARRGGGRQPSARPTRLKTSRGRMWQNCTGVGRCERPQRKPCEARSGQAATPSQAALGGRLNHTGRAAVAAPSAKANAPTFTTITRWRQEDKPRNPNAFLGRGWTKCIYRSAQMCSRWCRGKI